MCCPCRPVFSTILLRLEQMLQQTPEELHAEVQYDQVQDHSPAGSQASSSGMQQAHDALEQQHTQQMQTQTQQRLQAHLTLQQQMQQATAQGITLPGGQAPAPAEGHSSDVAVTGDWTM